MKKLCSKINAWLKSLKAFFARLVHDPSPGGSIPPDGMYPMW